ncbi:regulator of chromosome condensation 1/beta-lactamase-inhibitor protein II [Suillus subalutaceus]|uniref:regulator of chromosome condensation 1/beta-lactamase-inhibitor protein II n=1 Tax=Suillus subalutaceus TaxID=48586 RepID=UPI001B85EA27|nr:regulator of chromosome condensation 1/beta-lactamase-inhibitor protein II [Suillus subalutaceus]KAG1877771.1 regulator of chromosome condensation 1/beta-lactamase-inhibitor protein II [Suillus subalutaceus]
MFKRTAAQAWRSRRLHSHISHTAQAARARPARSAVIASSAVATAGLLWYSFSTTIHNDAIITPKPEDISKSVQKASTSSTGITEDDGSICAVAWGSNQYNVIDPNEPGVQRVQCPVNASWLKGVALRDLALHERHAACVDARGDVYQWGDGFFGSSPTSKSEQQGPKLTLRGHNIIQLQLTESRIYALSASGKIYVIAANAEQQKAPPPQPLPASTTSWWRPGWIWGAQGNAIDFMEITPKQKLGWGEQFVSISAGRNHLLALTSSGRTMVHPMNKNANTHGQLGLRKFDIPTPPSSTDIVSPSRIPVELVPRAAADPFAKASPFSRSATSSVPLSTSTNIDGIDDQHIRFSDALFEIPSLQGIKASQIAAGDRTSFVITDSGRVLGWGANEFGQIGLGGSMTLDTIILPTEVVLSRNVPISVRTRCIDISAGGDLTCFVAERTDGESLVYVDLLTCGNGQWGGLGNNQYSNAQGNPVRAKNVSGLREYNEDSRTMSPILPHAISVSPTGHVLLTLDTQAHGGPGGLGRDLVVWGTNHDYQLGTGKRSSLPVPTTLERPEGGRFILGQRKAPVRDLAGKIWKKKVEVEQCAVAGYGNSIIYWKIR